jgi:Ca2+-binding RTX toxin-like protein
MRRALLLFVPLAVSIFLATPASAGVTADFASGALTVHGSAGDDDIRVECANGDVAVNGLAPSGAPACSAVESIVVRAGAGADRVTLADVGGGAFTRLTEIDVFGEEDDDELIGSSLADRIDGGPGFDVLRGGNGDDVLAGSAHGGEAFGGKGRDTIFGSGGGYWSITEDSLVRDEPSETTTFSGIERAEIVGGGGDDNIRTSSFSGAVKVNGGDGDDGISTGVGPDHLIGGAGNDWLTAGEGNDLLEGKGGVDVLRGDAGNDRHYGGPGDDTCLGGVGSDTFFSC